MNGEKHEARESCGTQVAMVWRRWRVVRVLLLGSLIWNTIGPRGMTSTVLIMATGFWFRLGPWFVKKSVVEARMRRAVIFSTAMPTGCRSPLERGRPIKKKKKLTVITTHNLQIGGSKQKAHVKRLQKYISVIT